MMQYLQQLVDESVERGRQRTTTTTTTTKGDKICRRQRTTTNNKRRRIVLVTPSVMLIALNDAVTVAWQYSSQDSRLQLQTSTSIQTDSQA